MNAIRLNTAKNLNKNSYTWTGVVGQISLIYCDGGYTSTQKIKISNTGLPQFCHFSIMRLFPEIIFRHDGLTLPLIRGLFCPHADLDNDHDDPLEVLVIRGHWQFREALICVKHHRQLVPLWTIQAPIDRYDFSQHLPAIATSLNAGELNSQPCDPTPYDIWLDRRLENGKDETWLSSQTVYAVSTFCLLLGVQLQSLSRSQVNDDWQSRHMALASPRILMSPLYVGSLLSSRGLPLEHVLHLVEGVPGGRQTAPGRRYGTGSNHG